MVGHYKATQWNDQARQYVDNNDMVRAHHQPSPHRACPQSPPLIPQPPPQGVYITVEENFDNDHRVVSQRGSASGKFTFSAADSGEHRLCFTPTNVPATSGFLFSGTAAGGVKLELDMAIGETSQIESSDKDKMGEVVQKVKDLNARLQDIRREQVFQREREAEFRDQSESVNSRVVRWMLIQLFVLGATCAWQLTYLRAFFIKQKLT